MCLLMLGVCVCACICVWWVYERLGYRNGRHSVQNNYQRARPKFRLTTHRHIREWIDLRTVEQRRYFLQGIIMVIILVILVRADEYAHVADNGHIRVGRWSFYEFTFDSHGTYHVWQHAVSKWTYSINFPSTLLSAEGIPTTRVKVHRVRLVLHKRKLMLCWDAQFENREYKLIDRLL